MYTQGEGSSVGTELSGWVGNQFRWGCMDVFCAFVQGWVPIESPRFPFPLLCSANLHRD